MTAADHMRGSWCTLRCSKSATLGQRGELAQAGRTGERLRMTIYRTILARGYLPKELPPDFTSELFAKYATTLKGRANLHAYKPADNFTNCVVYNLALPGRNRRELRILHPFAFTKLASVVAKNFGRLLKLAARSPFAKSRPIYSANRQRAIQPMMNPSNLAKERSAIRAGAAYLLKADVSQFYPSLYTHAVGWAIDPKLRSRANWRKALLGRNIDQTLMDANGKVSQGVATGNDISFLLAEGVLGRVDRSVRFSKQRSYRWFDDYEVAFDSKEEAEVGLTKLQRELDRFKLRLNPAKTEIVELPHVAQESWQQQLLETGRAKFSAAGEMVRHFDVAFRLRHEYPDAPVLLYAIAVLFKIVRPDREVGRIAQSCITQALLGEPGAAQKGFALLSFWQINGFSLNADLLRETICKMITRHQWRGASSDISWALAFCLEGQISLNKSAADVLSRFDDDCIVLQALHLHALGLLPGFVITRVQKLLKSADLDREHWLLAYESVRHNFLTTSSTAVKSNHLFSDLLAKKISFYRTKLPRYALILHPGGAPEWTVRRWLKALSGEIAASEIEGDVFKLMLKDLARVPPAPASPDETRANLLDVERKEGGGDDEMEEELPQHSVVFD